MDKDGKTICNYFPVDPESDRAFQLWMSENGVKYFPESQTIRIPYHLLRDSVISPYSFWYQILNYSAETEISVQAFEEWKKSLND